MNNLQLEGYSSGHSNAGTPLTSPVGSGDSGTGGTGFTTTGEEEDGGQPPPAGRAVVDREARGRGGDLGADLELECEAGDGAAGASAAHAQAVSDKEMERGEGRERKTSLRERLSERLTEIAGSVSPPSLSLWK